MPKSKKPSRYYPQRIGAPKPVSDDIFDEISQYFPNERRSELTNIFKEIFNSNNSSKLLIEQQSQKTTPAAVIKQLDNLSIAIEPFIDPTLGTDDETFDLLHIPALKMKHIIDLRREALKEIKLNGGSAINLRIPFVNSCNLVFVESAKPGTDLRSWRSYLSLCLQLADFDYPDPTSSQSKFDSKFNANWVRAELGSKIVPT